ncbi:hypothetical protein EVAR_42405_1 [Eumeta japonica]|uniref:Uncharacterized protein n=1 Tax=Eumeta variegata TaxID=151549 RepID=A0A4C1X8Y2_EUMVA|nr:hypothetical protein EVAR_42405_1 [Eumeta japonica]
MPEWKGRVPLTRSHCERITVRRCVSLVRAPGTRGSGRSEMRGRFRVGSLHRVRGGCTYPPPAAHPSYARAA